jgi:hypothetical protein
MRLAGVEVLDSAVAGIAQRLEAAGHTSLGIRLGLGVDTGASFVPTTQSGRDEILSVLSNDCPPHLMKLRDVLDESRYGQTG